MIRIECDRINQIAIDYLRKILETERRFTTIYHSFFAKNMENIILSKFENLQIIIRLFDDHFASLNPNYKGTHEYKKYVNYMTNQYNKFINKNGMWLAKQLNVDTCPYCNRQYIFTVDSKKKVRPQFDHFFSKKKYPYLALSFYNLIPCCPTCNYIKGEERIDYNPYFHEFGSKYLFETNHHKFMINNDKLIIDFSASNSNIECFNLKEIYQFHQDYAIEIIKKAYYYNKDYYKGFIESFGEISNTQFKDIHRLIWGNYIDISDYPKRPLSKLTHDILEQIGIK